MSRIIFEGQVAFANNDAANSIKTLDIPTDPTVKGDVSDDVVVEVRNPGASVLTVKARQKEAPSASFGGGSTRYPLVQAFAGAVPAGAVDGVELFVKDWALDSTPGRLEISNDTVIGGAGAFVCDVRVRA